MLDLASLQVLRARLLAASGPDRDLDRDIAFAMGWTRTMSADGGATWSDPSGDFVYGHSRNGREGNYAPRFTSSIDESIALVERMLPGCFTEISGPRKYLNIPTPVPNVWLAIVSPERTADRRGWGVTAPLAILVALLSALISQQGATA